MKINKKTIFGILGALGVAAASGAGGKIATTLMDRTVKGSTDDDGHEPTPDELVELAEACPEKTEEELINESIEETEEDVTES